MRCRGLLPCWSCFGASSGFDTVCHNILPQKLMNYGLDKGTASWMENWLNGWAQRVVISGTNSSKRPVISGVTQGLYWGPNCLTS